MVQNSIEGWNRNCVLECATCVLDYARLFHNDVLSSLPIIHH
jgi:hypothetical protein